MSQTLAATAEHRVLCRRVSGAMVLTIPAIVCRTLDWKAGDTIAVQMKTNGELIYKRKAPPRKRPARQG